MISKDGGTTWELSTDVYGEWSARPKILRTADEPAIVAISDKDIFMVLRSARDDGYAEETWSHDGGRTWELPKPGKLHEFNTPTGLWRMKNGWVVRLWNNSKSALRFPLVAPSARTTAARGPARERSWHSQPAASGRSRHPIPASWKRPTVRSWRYGATSPRKASGSGPAGDSASIG